MWSSETIKLVWKIGWPKKLTTFELSLNHII